MSEIRLEVDGTVAVLILDRPERLNALDAAMHEQLEAAWAEVKANPDLRAIVVTGTGRGFCVGMDLKQVSDRSGFRPSRPGSVHDAVMMTALNNDIWLPTIVAVNGVCAGGGLHFILDADYVIASEDASFVDPHVTVGQVSALEPITLIPRIGLGNALALAVLGRSGRIDAGDALRVGLVNEVVPADRLLERAGEIARGAAAGSPAAVERTKRAIWGALELPLADALQAGWESLTAHRDHPDALEGPRAFSEKRPARWTMPPTTDGSPPG